MDRYPLRMSISNFIYIKSAGPGVHYWERASVQLWEPGPVVCLLIAFITPPRQQAQKSALLPFIRLLDRAEEGQHQEKSKEPWEAVYS